MSDITNDECSIKDINDQMAVEWGNLIRDA